MATCNLRRYGGLHPEPEHLCGSEEIFISKLRASCLKDAMKEVADLYPDQKFVIIDTEVDSKPNVASAIFKEQQPSYLVGVAAAMKAKEAGKTKVGFIGGVENPIIERFEAGYKQGVASVDPAIEVLTDYANAFDDPGKGSTLAQKQYNDGVYVIFHAAGATGNGLIKEANTVVKQAKTFGLSALTLTSMMQV